MPTKYYKKNQESLRKEACERYQNLSEEETNKKGKKAREKYLNFSEKQKEKSLYERNKNLSKD